MFEKNYSINTGRLTTFAPLTACLKSRLAFLNDEEVLVITNDETHYTFNIYKKDGSVRNFLVDISYGQILSVMFFKGDIWLELRYTEGAYEEEYSIARITDGILRVVASFRRESYMHEMCYHSLFIKDDAVYLHLIKHNRLHYYIIDESAEEIDVMEGGKWYLCDSYPICAMRNIIELYDQSLNISSTIEYDYEIDELLCDEAANMLAFTLTDLAQEQTALMIYQSDADALHITYLEHTIASMGLSGGRVWLNPYGFNEQQELGGCMVYDRYAWPLYVHLRAKGTTGSGSFGTYSPPFHRCESVEALAYGMTGIVEHNRLLMLDYACKPTQEIFIEEPSLLAIAPQGDKIAVLTLNNATNSDELTVHENTNLTVYSWSSIPDDSKVIDMSKFHR